MRLVLKIEIQMRNKITSLTLMTIMITGGMTFAVPGVMPAAHAANANLFVSAENSQFDNYMSGPQVIEVVVIDSDINDTDEAKGEPDVTVNGKILRMVQGVDGNWYGYFADRTQALIADSTAYNGEGLDFGEFCGSQVTIFDGTGFTRVDFTDTVGVAFPTGLVAGVNGTADATPIPTTQCGTDVNVAANTATGNVVRESKDPVDDFGTVNTGQLNIDPDLWPFIQLYALNPTGNVVVQYNKGGGVQSTTLTFDTVDQFADIELDRAIYPPGSQVHVYITDLWLNIDPTDEDSWTFGSITNGSASTNYQVFDENGGRAGDLVDFGAGVIDISESLNDLMCEDNCVLLLDPDNQGTGNVLTIQDNDDSSISNNVNQNDDDPSTFETTGKNLDGKFPITITEQGPNSGVFSTSDESDVSAIKILDGASRGTSATIDYNEHPMTILVGFSSGSIDIQPVDDNWNSGEEIPVYLIDNNANKNSRADEDLDLFDPDVAYIPSLQIGSPITLEKISSATFDPNGISISLLSSEEGVEDVEQPSQRVFLRNSNGSDISVVAGDEIHLNLGKSFGELYATMHEPGLILSVLDQPGLKGYTC